LHLLGAGKLDIGNRKHFFATAAKLMRQVLMDRARAKLRDERGGGVWQQVEFVEAGALPIDENTDMPALDEALKQLAALDPRMAEVLELRYFSGLEVSEVGRLFEVEERTISRDWAMEGAVEAAAELNEVVLLYSGACPSACLRMIKNKQQQGKPRSTGAQLKAAVRDPLSKCTGVFKLVHRWTRMCAA
jgi:hypothetical protein